MTLALKTTTICAAPFLYKAYICHDYRPISKACGGSSTVGCSGGYKSQELSVFSMNNEHGILLTAFL